MTATTLPITTRLKAIEAARQAELAQRYEREYPDITPEDSERLALMVCGARIFLIAEMALEALPQEDVDAILSRWEK